MQGVCLFLKGWGRVVSDYWLLIPINVADPVS